MDQATAQIADVTLKAGAGAVPDYDARTALRKYPGGTYCGDEAWNPAVAMRTGSGRSNLARATFLYPEGIFLAGSQSTSSIKNVGGMVSHHLDFEHQERRRRRSRREGDCVTLGRNQTGRVVAQDPILPLRIHNPTFPYPQTDNSFSKLWV